MRAVLSGVLAGLVVSGVIVALVLASLPDAPIGAIPTPSASPTPVATPSPTPRPRPTTSPASPSAAPSGFPSGETGLTVGATAPALALPRLGGGTVDLADLRGRPVWVNFTASWCPTCRDELPFMDRIGTQLGDELAIVVVDVREDEAIAQALVDELSLSLPVALDTDGTAQQAWAAYALPVHYWLDGEGIVRRVLWGGPDPDRMVDAVKTVLPDAEIDL